MIIHNVDLDEGGELVARHFAPAPRKQQPKLLPKRRRVLGCNELNNNGGVENGSFSQHPNHLVHLQLLGLGQRTPRGLSSLNSLA